MSKKMKSNNKKAPVPQMQQQMPQMQQQMQMNNAMQQQMMSNNFQMQAPQNFPAQLQQMPASNMGVFGPRRANLSNKNLPDIFNDDEPLIEKVKEEAMKEAKIHIDIKAQRSMAKLKEEVMLPAMCSLSTEGGNRTSVDLICVIDISGSMSGQKLDLVKETMRYLIETLTPADRLSIITFESSGDRICGLKCVTPENIPAFDGYITGIQSRGGTNINSGLSLALKTIRERKYTNKVTSIFLLSDGQDRGAEHQFSQSLKLEENQNLGVFSINSFGFGTDHDEELMTKICQLKDGDFYFIKELATLDEAFCNALGGIISLVATDVVINLKNISKGLLEGLKIKKTYGDMWSNQTDKHYTIKIQQLMTGISKDYVFEILVPKIDAEVGDLDRDHDILEANFTALAINKEKMQGEVTYKLTMLNEKEEIPEVNENVDVIENHLRVQASEAIEVNMKMAENQKYDEAQKGIDSMIQNIQSNKKARQDKMEHLVSDLQNIKQKCSANVYHQEGKKYMKSAQMAHQAQQNFAYSNCIQQEMVSMQKMKKSHK